MILLHCAKYAKYHNLQQNLHLTHEIRHLTSEIGHSTRETRHLTSEIRHLTSEIWQQKKFTADQMVIFYVSITQMENFFVSTLHTTLKIILFDIKIISKLSFEN